MILLQSASINGSDISNASLQDGADDRHSYHSSLSPPSVANADSPNLVIDGDTADFSRWAMGERETACDLSTVRNVKDATTAAEPAGSGHLLFIEGPATGMLTVSIYSRG